MMARWTAEKDATLRALWAAREGGRLAFHLLLLLALGMVGALLLAAALAHGHGPHMTPAEEAWLDRQHARDGTKCCDVRDVHVGQAVAWRITPRGYEVEIDGAWHLVPPGRLLAPIPGDPSPFGAQALLFYTPRSGGPPAIWCFLPEPLM
jgi:hypothetical protein